MSQINITVEEFIDSYREIIGYGSENKCAYDLVNRARIIAYPMGNWVGTQDLRPIRVVNNRFTLPYDLETIQSAKSFNDREVSIGSEFSLSDYKCCMEDVIVKSESRSALPFQLTENCPVIFYAVNKKDERKEMEVSYKDHPSGTYREEVVTLKHQEHTRLTNFAGEVTRIRKGITHGKIAVINGANQGLLYPEDKNPSFSEYNASICNGCIVVHAKKKYIPYSIENNNAILDINPEALSTLVIAIKAKDKRSQNWPNEYAASVKIAKDFLLAELNNEKSVSLAFLPVDYDNRFHDSLEQP